MSVQNDPAPLLTPAQVNHLLAGFRQIDRLLVSIEEVADGQESGLFPRVSPDLTQPRKDLLLRFVAAMRQAIAAILESNGMAIPKARTTASRAVSSALTFIDIAISDLRPKVMRGYGEVSEDAAQALDRIVAELRSLQGNALRGFNSERRDERTK